MQYALIDVDNVVQSVVDLNSPSDWFYPEEFTIVEADGFVFNTSDYEYSDYIYVDGSFILDTEGIAERKANEQLEPREVLAALFQTQPNAMAALPDDVLTHMASYMQVWESGVSYTIGDMRQYQEKPYRCLQAHTSQQEWKPDISPSLWARIIASEDPDNPLPWEQPDSTNPYMKGDRVTHNGKTWESLIDYNVYEPGVAGWEEVTA